MFENIGKKLKKVAVIVFIFGIIFSVTRGIMFMKAFYVDGESYVVEAEADDPLYYIKANDTYTRRVTNKVDSSPYIIIKNPDYVEPEDGEEDEEAIPYLIVSNPDYIDEVEEITDNFDPEQVDRYSPFEILANPDYTAPQDYKTHLSDFFGIMPITVADGHYVVNLFGLFPFVAQESYQFVLVGVSVVLIGVLLSWLAYLVLAGLGEVVQRSEDSINVAKKLN